MISEKYNLFKQSEDNWRDHKSSEAQGGRGLQGGVGDTV